MPHAARASGFRLSTGTCPAGYYLTPTAELRKTERGSISTNEPSILSMSQNQAIRSDKFDQILPTCCRPTVDHSLVAGRAQCPVTPGAPAGWPYGAMPVLCLLSLISRNSPEQLGMMSPELASTQDGL